MARVVVVGGGLGGMAAAARLAKLGHRVTLVEAGDRLGGAIGTVTLDGFRWQTGPTRMLLPAVVRDLFRKSGRAAERELAIVPVEPAREHRFDDDTVLRMPAGSRADQLQAVTDALGRKQAEAWVGYVDDLAPVWESLRRDLFERPWSTDHAGKTTRSLLESRVTLHKHVRKTLRDERLQQVALLPALLDGHQPRDVPAWVGMWAYLEQAFGVWTVEGGMAALTDVLTDRLSTRKVTVRTGTAAGDLVVRGDRVVGVHTDEGVLDADTVVVAIDPRRLPALAAYVERTMPAIPPVVTHLGLVGEVPDLPGEVVLHGDPLVVLRTDGDAPEGAHAWTTLGRGRTGEDVVNVLARNGIRIRDLVEARLDVSPREQVEQWNGSPYGVLWQGRGSLFRRLGPRTPVRGVYVAGAHTPLGAGVPSVGLSAALVAQLVGPV